MPVHTYKSGLGSVGAYQASGKPFTTGSLSSIASSALEITFPSVTRWVCVVNHDATNALSCSFSALGMTETYNYFRVGPKAAASSNAASTQRLELKVKSLFFSGSTDFDVIAGCTGIDTYAISTNWSGSSGVG